MIIDKELMLGIPHFRANWFAFRLLYLKTLIKIFGLINRLKNESP